MYVKGTNIHTNINCLYLVLVDTNIYIHTYMNECMYVCEYIHLFTTKYCIKQCIIGSQRQLQILPSSLCFFFSLLPVLYPSTFLTSTILTSIPAQASIIITKSASHICLHLQHPPSLYIFLRDLEPSVSTFFFFFVLVLTPFV